MDQQPLNQKNKQRKLINGLARIFIRSVIDAAGSEKQNSNPDSEAHVEKAEKINNFIDKYSSNISNQYTGSNQSGKTTPSTLSPDLSYDQNCDDWDTDNYNTARSRASEKMQNVGRMEKSFNKDKPLFTPQNKQNDDVDKCRGDQVSPCGSDRWSPELLKAHALPPGTSWADLVEDDMENILVQMSPALFKYHNNGLRKTPGKMSSGVSGRASPEEVTNVSLDEKRKLRSLENTRRHINFEPTSIPNVSVGAENWADELLDVLSHMDNSTCMKKEYVKEKNITVTVNDGNSSSQLSVHTRLDIDTKCNSGIDAQNNEGSKGNWKVTNKLNNGGTSASNSDEHRRFSPSGKSSAKHSRHESNNDPFQNNKYIDHQDRRKETTSYKNSRYVGNKQNMVQESVPIAIPKQNHAPNWKSSSPEDWSTELVDVPDTLSMYKMENDMKQHMDGQHASSGKFHHSSSTSNNDNVNIDGEEQSNSFAFSACETNKNVKITRRASDDKKIDEKNVCRLYEIEKENLANESWNSELIAVPTPAKFDDCKKTKDLPSNARLRGLVENEGSKLENAPKQFAFQESNINSDIKLRNMECTENLKVDTYEPAHSTASQDYRELPSHPKLDRLHGSDRKEANKFENLCKQSASQESEVNSDIKLKNVECVENLKIDMYQPALSTTHHDVPSSLVDVCSNPVTNNGLSSGNIEFDRDSLDSSSQSDSIHELEDLCDLPYDDKNDESEEEYSKAVSLSEKNNRKSKRFTSINEAILFLEKLRCSDWVTTDDTSIDGIEVSQDTCTATNINLSVNVVKSNCSDCPCRSSPLFQFWNSMPSPWGWYEHGYGQPMPPYGPYPYDYAAYQNHIQVSTAEVCPPVEDMSRNTGKSACDTEDGNPRNCDRNFDHSEQPQSISSGHQNLMDIYEQGKHHKNNSCNNADNRRSSCGSLLNTSIVQYSSSSFSESDNDDKENGNLKSKEKSKSIGHSRKGNVHTNGLNNRMSLQTDEGDHSKGQLNSYDTSGGKKSDGQCLQQKSIQYDGTKSCSNNVHQAGVENCNESIEDCNNNIKPTYFNLFYNENGYNNGDEFPSSNVLGKRKDFSDRHQHEVELRKKSSSKILKVDNKMKKTEKKSSADAITNEQPEFCEQNQLNVLNKNVSIDKNVNIPQGADKVKMNKSCWSEIVKTNKSVNSKNLSPCQSTEVVDSKHNKLSSTNIGKPTILKKKNVPNILVKKADNPEGNSVQCDNNETSPNLYVPPYKRLTNSDDLPRPASQPPSPPPFPPPPPGFAPLSTSAASPLFNYVRESAWSNYYGENFPPLMQTSPTEKKTTSTENKASFAVPCSYGQRKPDCPFWYTPPSMSMSPDQSSYSSPYYLSPASCIQPNTKSKSPAEKGSPIETRITGSSRIESLKKRIDCAKFLPPRFQRKHLMSQGYTEHEISSVLGPQPAYYLDYDWKKNFKERCDKYHVEFVDSHCHIDLLFQRQGFTGSFTKYKLVHEETFPRNFAGCVAIFCNPFTFKPTGLWKDVAEESDVWLAMGCHPKCATDFTERAGEQLEECLKHEKMVALGEIGLDYSGTFFEHKEVQKRFFIRHLQIALKMRKPLVIHCRDAEEDVLEIMEQYVPRNHKIHCHCFTANYNSAEKWMNKFNNVFFGLTPLVTYKTATPTHEVARKIPLQKLLLETDAPYFVPHKVPKGDMKFSHPGMAIIVAEEVARLKGIAVLDVLMACRNNTYAMYGI